MPDAAEIHPLVLELDDRDDLGEVGQRLDERIFDRLREIGCEAQELLGCEVLVAKEDHEMIEQRLADCRDRAGIERFAQVGPEQLGPQRPGNRPDFHDPPSFRRQDSRLRRSRRNRPG
jgi:hypothetical protein